jgi:BirA family transcriptional regulator, biotin operon repressor / biotin---[acetyl-CoA-carboxylase] ligase
MIIGSNLYFFKDLPSTNSHAASFLKEKTVAEGSVIYTNFQTAGKGYAGNRWEAEDGKNLLISIILYPSFLRTTDQFYLSMTISLGICDFIDRYISGCRVKWPNDIYINNDKIAGILIESAILADTIEYSVAGIGLNINQEKFLSNAPNPVSLYQLTGRTYDLPKCLDQLTGDLDKRYKDLISGNLSKIKEEYISKLYRLNKIAQFRDRSESFTGKIISIGEYGSIKIETGENKIREFGFKEVEFIL